MLWSRLLRGEMTLCFARWSSDRSRAAGRDVHWAEAGSGDDEEDNDNDDAHSESYTAPLSLPSYSISQLKRSQRPEWGKPPLSQVQFPGQSS